MRIAVFKEREQRRQAILRMTLPSLNGAMNETVEHASKHDLIIERILLRRGYLSLSGVSDSWKDIQALATAAEDQGYDVEIEQEKMEASERILFNLKGKRST